MTSNESKLLIEIEQDINNGRFKVAKDNLSKISFSTKQLKRESSHLLSKISLYTGDYDQCIKIIDETQASHGHYIGLLADKCCALYLQGDYLAWQLSVDKLEKELNLCSPFLKKANYIKSATCLAKFKEELGCIHEALNIYYTLLKSLDQLVDDYPMVLAQIVRLKSKWNLQNELRQLYRDLFAINAKRYHQNFNIELHHALLISELELFGVDTAMKRLDDTRSFLDEQDLSLFISEVIEYQLKNSLKVSQSLVNELEKSNCCSFERDLVRLARDQFPKLDAMPLHSTLTLHIILLRKSLSNAKGILRQSQFLVESFSKETQQIWQDQLNQSSTITITVSKTRLTYFKGSLDLKRKKVALAIIQSFKKESSLKLEALCHEVWKAEYNESYYHRIRVALKRINTEISQLFKVPDMFTINSDSVELTKDFKLNFKE